MGYNPSSKWTNPNYPIYNQGYNPLTIRGMSPKVLNGMSPYLKKSFRSITRFLASMRTRQTRQALDFHRLPGNDAGAPETIRDGVYTMLIAPKKGDALGILGEIG